MYKQEDYGCLNAECTPPNSDIHLDEYHIITNSPPFDIDINDVNIIPLINGGISLSQGNLLELSTSQFEETMDVAAKFEQREFPVSPRGPPERKDFAGDVDFHVEINAQDTHKKKYLYSNILNRIYVDMKIDFPVVFRWKAGFGPNPAFVRACVVFSDESQGEKRVERCTQHTHDASNADISQEIVKNVLHSSREMGTHGVYYCGRPELADSWYSVVVALGPDGGSHAFQFVCKNSCSSGINRRAIDVPATIFGYISQEIVKNVLHSSREMGTHGVYYCGRPELADSWYSVVVALGPDGGSHAFQFVCKNSCSSGINRRAIDVIFTFEDANGTVYGRQTVGARVCSCPRRDLTRDEEESRGKSGKRRVQHKQPAHEPHEPRAKKIKLETAGVDDAIMALPPLQIVGSRAMAAGLQVMLSMMEAAAELRRSDSTTNDRYASRISALREKIEELKRNH